MVSERVRLLLSVVSELTGVAPSEILQPAIRRVADARWLAVWLNCRVVGRSINETASDFGLNPLAVAYMRRRSGELHEADPAWRERADTAQQMLLERRAAFQEGLRTRFVTAGADGSAGVL